MVDPELAELLPNERPKRRLTWKSGIPRPADEGWAPGAKRYLQPGELMLSALLRQPAWASIYLPFIERVQTLWGGGRLWTAHELELAKLVAIEHGVWFQTGNRGLRKWLADPDRHLARSFVGFELPRSERHLALVHDTIAARRLELPSQAALSRYHRFVPWDARAEIACSLFEAIRDEGLLLPEVQKLLSIHYLDSYDIFITGRPPKTESKEGQRSRHRTVPGASWIGYRRADKPGGPGFKVHTLTFPLGLPLILAFSGIHEHDKTAARARLLPKLRVLIDKWDRELRVMIADTAYYGDDFLRDITRMDYIPNIHESSHSESENTKREVAKKDQERIAIEGTKWFANGHFEFFCSCGRGTTSARVTLGKRRALLATQLECDECGDETMTAGRWRIKQNRKRFSRSKPGDSEDVLRFAFGLPLTYNDPRSEELGKDRFGHGEGFHGQLKRAYGLGGKDNPCPIECAEHLEYVTYMIAAIMWANAIEQIISRRDDARARAGAAA